MICISSDFIGSAIMFRDSKVETVLWFRIQIEILWLDPETTAGFTSPGSASKLSASFFVFFSCG